MYRSDGRFVAELPEDEIEPITSHTFSELIEESLGKERKFILARIKTRDKLNFKKYYYHYF